MAANMRDSYFNGHPKYPLPHIPITALKSPAPTFWSGVSYVDVIISSTYLPNTPARPPSEGLTSTMEDQRNNSNNNNNEADATSLESDTEELQHMPLAPPLWNHKRRLSKQLSMCETPRDRAWERRRRQMLRQVRKRETGAEDFLTDEDMSELKGCIELGFGFNEEEGQRLCPTLPALDLYFAVNRQLSPSPVSTPNSVSSSSELGGRSSSFDSMRSESDWTICSPGDDPQQVKTKLRHWAQAVACSMMQSPR